MVKSTGSTGRNVGVYLTESEEARLIEIATELGCLTRGGPATGAPSVRALLREIAAGEVVARRRTGRPRGPASATARVRAEIERDPGASGADIARRVGCSTTLVSRVRAGQR